VGLILVPGGGLVSLIGLGKGWVGGKFGMWNEGVGQECHRDRFGTSEPKGGPKENWGTSKPRLHL